jgi:FHA domain
MVKCPFCGFDNEDGALFCEQCKSDLSAVPATPTGEVPMAEVVEAAPVMVEPVPEAMPFAAVEAVAATTTPVAQAVESAVAAPVAEPVAPPVAAPAGEAAAAAPAGASVPPGSQPKLVVRRGLKIGVEFPIYAEYNYIGRADEKPVDVDLEDQEPPDRVWCSRQHAVIHFDEAAGNITIEDLNSSNGTYVNRNRVYPGQKKQLFANDTVQIGTVHLQLKA